MMSQEHYRYSSWTVYKTGSDKDSDSAGFLNTDLTRSGINNIECWVFFFKIMTAIVFSFLEEALL